VKKWTKLIAVTTAVVMVVLMFESCQVGNKSTFIEENGRPFNTDIKKYEWKVEVTTSSENQVYAFAKEEIELLVKAVAPDENQKKGKLIFNFVTDDKMSDFTFSRTGELKNSDFIITLKGKRPTEALNAFYTALEDMGYRFEVTGPIIPEKLVFSKVPTAEQIITPDVLRRGVREHINFPMDISSYPLGEAKEYIRNLARLRYNYITFHSYPGQWTWESYKNVAAFGVYRDWTTKKFSPSDMTLYNGAFFYGDNFAIPDYAAVKDKIRFNKEFFCFPEMEPYYYTYMERGKLAAAWLGNVMSECKHVGLEVQLSTEIRLADTEYNMQLLDRTLKDYPMIDALEFISRETGDEITGNFDEFSAKQKDLFVKILNAEDGKAIDKEYYTDNPQVLAYPVKDLAYSIRLAKHLIDSGWAKEKGIKVAAGCYVVSPQMLKLCSNLASEFLPKEVWYTIMPGHSSREVADNFVAAQISPELLKRTMIYSWLEFDGFMYMNQFAGTGIQKVIKDQKALINAPVPALMTNHWRNAENYMSFRYLDEVSLNSNLTPEEFVGNYADFAGIGNKQEFIDTMMAIDTLSDSRSFPGNIGFPIKDTWAVRPSDGSMGSVWWWGENEINNGIESFTKTAASLTKIANEPKHPQVKRLIRMLANESESARCHLTAVELMKQCAIRFDYTTYKMPTNLTAEEKALIVEKSNEAEKYLVEYMGWITKDMIDRGVEGTLINYYYGPFLMCNNVRAVYGGVGTYIDLNSDGKTVPQPITNQPKQ
jgi:hypothetical protein